MSTMSGIASKGEKGKSKYQCLDINNLYRGESLEPSQQKNTVQRCGKYGMQSLGKVPSARRPPANLPSLKSENSSSEPAVSLVPTGSAGWGNKPGETQSPTSTQPNVISNSNSVQSSASSLVQGVSTTVTSSNTVLPPQTAPLPSSHDQTVTPPIHTTTGDKSWSSIMAGEGGTHPPSFLAHQSPLFQQEFPKLSSGESQNAQIGQKGGSDTQYGPGPSLRPQTEGSWIQGGGRSQTGSLSNVSGTQSLVQGPLPHHSSGVDPGGRSSLNPHPPSGVAIGSGGPGLGIPNNGPVVHGPPIHLPPVTSPQFRTMSSSFMYRGSSSGPPGPFPPNFPSGIGPRQRFSSSFLTEGRFIGRPIDGEELVTRPIIKEEELNHMDDIARDSSWARPDEIDYNEKIVFSDAEDSPHEEEGRALNEEKKKRSRENRDITENEKDKNRDEKERVRDRIDRDRDSNRRSEDRSEKRSCDLSSRNWQIPNYNRYSSTTRSQHSAIRDRETEEEKLKEKRKLQIELIAVVTERATQRKEEEEKRHEETKRAAAKKLQMLDERSGKNQVNDKKEKEDANATVVPLPNWKNKQSDCDRDRSRLNSESVDDKSRHESSDFRSTSQVDRQTFLRNERDSRQRSLCDDRTKKDHDEKDKMSIHRQDRTRMEERERNLRSTEGQQSYTRHFQNNMPPRFLKQQAERSQFGVSQNNTFLRSSNSPQPSNQSTSSNNFESRWNYSGGSFAGQSSVISNGSRTQSRRFNSESSESTSEKLRNDREAEEWDSSQERYKSNRERNYGKHGLYYDADHIRRFYERREIDSERTVEDNWDRDNSRSRDPILREKDRTFSSSKDVEEHLKTDINHEEGKEWRRNKEHKSEEKDVELDDARENLRKDERKEDVTRVERPPRPESRDSRASRESRNSKDSIREEKHDVDQKICNNSRGFVSIIDSHYKEEKKKSTDRRDEREKNDQGTQGKYADEYPCPFPNKPRHRFNYLRHIPGPPITREKLEASESNDTKRSLTQLKRFSDGKRTNEEKENAENEIRNSQNLKHVPEEKNKTVVTDKKESGKQIPELAKQDSQEKKVKIEVKEDKEGKVEKQIEEKEKSEKSGKNRGGKGRTESSRGRQGWSVSVYRNSFGNRGDRRRRDSGRVTGRSRFANREWAQLSESDISVDDLSVSTESGKEDKKSDAARHSKPRTNFKKNEKESRYKEHNKNESGDKGNFEATVAPRFERKNEYVGNGREGFAPSGQPSRRGRGAIRMRGGISRRMDGYGPPSAKSPFGQQDDKKTRPAEKANDTPSIDDKGHVEEIKGKHKQQTASLAMNSSGLKTISLNGNKIYRMPPRMQKKIEAEPRESNRHKVSRGTRYHGNKPISDQGDDVWETTSENSEDDRKNDSRGSRKNYQKRTPYVRESTNTTSTSSRSGRHNTRSNSTPKKFSNRDVQGNKNNDIGSDKNSNSRNAVAPPHSSKTEGNSNKEEMKSVDANLFNQSSSADKGRQGGGEGKDFDEGRNKMKDLKDHSKSERKLTRDKERRNKSVKDSSNQQQQQITASVLTAPSGPQPLMSQVVPAPPSVAKNYERKLNLPPRFAKQRRIQKQQSIEVCENKINHPVNIFPAKEQGTNAPVTNAWEKPLRSVSPGKSPSVQVILNSSEAIQSENSSQQSSPHVSRDTVDKTLLDGSSPPVNTIIFENTNFKSTPNDIILKNQFNSHMKSPRTEKGNNSERKIPEEPQEMLGFSGKPDLSAAVTDREIKTSEQSMIYGKTEDNSDMKLDFQFETELSQLTDDKTSKGMRDLSRSIQQSTMSPSTADLNFKIASVKKVWENMHTVSEHSEDGNNVNTFSPNFSPDSTMDPSTYSKTVEGSISVAEEGNEVVYNNVSQMQVNVNYTASKTDVSSTTSNVCKVKPQQQSVLNPGHSPIGHTGQSPLSHSGPISPPPYSTTQAGQFNYQQAGIGNTAAQFGGMSAIPSPPTVLYNSSTQLPPAYQTFQIDGSQVLSSQAARSQFSQFPPYGLSQGISQTSAFSQQSVYLHQTAPPTPAPDLYQSSLSQYRLQPATGPYGQSQLNNNPNTVLISSTSNSLMSATVKPSTQPIGAIGTKGATPFQQNALPSQHSQLFIPYEPVQLGVNQSYLPNSQIVPRGTPVQPSASSFYSGSAGAQAGFYQTPGSTLAQQAPGAPQLHQATGYSLQGFNSQSSAAAVGIQGFGSQMGAQQYRTAGSLPPTTYLKSSVTHHPANISLTQKNSVTSQQDVLDSVFSSAPQITSPKSRPSKQIGQQQPQQSSSQQSNNKFASYQNVTQSSSQLQPSGGQQRVTQSNINLQNARSTGSPRYPSPIQRPVSYHHSSTRYRTQPCRPASSVKPYFGSQDGNLKLEEGNDLKTDESAEINCDTKLSDSSAQAKLDGSEDDTPKD